MLNTQQIKILCFGKFLNPIFKSNPRTNLTFKPLMQNRNTVLQTSSLNVFFFLKFKCMF